MSRLEVVRATAVLAAIGVFGVCAEIAAGDAMTARVSAADFVVGALIGAAGVFGLANRGRRLCGVFLLVATVLWFLATFAAGHTSVISALGARVGIAYRGALVTGVLLAVRSARSFVTVAVVIAAWVDAAVAALADRAWPSLVIAGLLVLACAVGVDPPRHGSRWFAPGLLAAGLVIPAVSSMAGEVADPHDRILLSTDLLLALAALTTIFSLARERRMRSRFADDLVNLAADGGLAGALAATLRDPTLRLLAPSAWSTRPGRAVLDIHGSSGELVALVEHSASIRVDAELSAAVGTAVLLQQANDERTAAMLQARDDLRAAQRRILVAADEARARLQRRLEREAVPRASRLRERLAQDPATVEAAAGLERAIAELRLLGAGLRPQNLADRGLASALRALAESFPIPITVDVPDVRHPADVELVAYFVVNEALTNAIKHAEASTIDISVREVGSALVVEVGDNGRGGALAGRGTGLDGLRARAGAVGGQIDVSSPDGAGTIVTLTVPR